MRNEMASGMNAGRWVEMGGAGNRRTHGSVAAFPLLVLLGLTLWLSACASEPTGPADSSARHAGNRNSQISLDVRHAWRLPDDCRLPFTARQPQPSADWMLLKGTCGVGASQLLIANLETDDRFVRPPWNTVASSPFFPLGNGQFVGLETRFSVGAIALDRPLLELRRIDVTDSSNAVERFPLLYENDLADGQFSDILTNVLAVEILDSQALLVTLTVVPTSGQSERVFRSFVIRNLQDPVPDFSALEFSGSAFDCAREWVGCGVAHWTDLGNGELVAWVKSFGSDNDRSRQTLVRGVLSGNVFSAVQHSSGHFHGPRANMVEAEAGSDSYLIVRRMTRFPGDGNEGLPVLEARRLSDFTVTGGDHTEQTEAARPNFVVPVSWCRCTLVTFREPRLELRDAQTLELLHRFRLPRSIRRHGITEVIPGRTPTEFFLTSGDRSRVWQVEIVGALGD